MKVQIINDEIVAYGEAISGENIYEINISDYNHEKYNYIPKEPGVFDETNFIKKSQDD